MKNQFYPDWQSFAFKYRGREEDAFEDLARTLFRKEMGIKYGLFQRVNHKGTETDVIKKDGMVVGFQSKYFKNEINVNVITDSMKKAKENYPDLTHYYIYCNLAFGNPKRRKSSKKTDELPRLTKKEERVETEAAKLGINIIWKQGKTILDEAIVEKWIYDVFFNVKGKLENLVAEEASHTQISFNNIKYACLYDGHEIHINRDGAISRIESQKTGSIFVIHGDGGSGKTAILHEFYDLYSKKYPICYRKANSLNVKNLAEIFHLGDTYSYCDFIEAFADSGRKYFIIDSAEHLDDMEEDTIVPSLIKGLIEDNWCVIFTVRNVFAGDLLNLLKTENPEVNIEREEVGLLSESSLKSIAVRYGISLPKDQTLLDRTKNLFYLALYTEYYSEVDQQTSDSSFLKLVWDKKIKRKCDRTGYIRENEFETFVLERMQKGSFFLPPEKYTSKEFYTLIDDEIIANDPSNGLFITHDIFEEWGMYRIVDRKWKEEKDLSSFLSSLGETRAIRRTFRLWLKDRATESPETIQSISKEIFSSNLPGLWKDEILCALLLSDKAAIFLAPYEKQILSSEHDFAERIIWSLRAGCQYVSNVINYKSYYIPNYAPIGSGWDFVIDFLFQNRRNVKMTQWLPVMLDWTKANHKGENTRKIGLMLIEYYQSEEYKSIRYENNINKVLHSIADNVVWEIKDELSELLLGCIENKDLSDDLPEFILKENIKALNIHLAIPQVVITLCLYYWREHEIEDQPQYGYYNRDRDCFGMDENGVAFKYFPAGADQTPMGALLIADEQKAIDFVIQLMNESVDIYSRSRDKDYLQRVEIISDEGTVNWQWNSATLWGMFRGMGSPVSPYSIQSVHMALEKYLLNLSKEEKYEQCEKILRRLLFECHSSSVSAVATSLVLAYPFQYWKIAMILFRTVSFFRMDLSRATSESQMEGFYKMSGQTLNKDVTEERLKTCKEAFRKSHLENVCLQYQFYNIPTLTDKENEERRQKIFDILDEHRKLLKQFKGEERDYLEIMLSRMDRRKLKVATTKKVEGGMEVHFETKLNKSAKRLSESAIVDQQEMFKYLGLLNWAIAKMKGEDAPNRTYEDDVCKVIHDAQALESDMSHGGGQGLMDKQTLPWVASCLIKFYREQLSAENLVWCARIIEEKVQGFDGLSDVMDGIYACIHVIPCLIELLPEYKDRYESLILQCLLVPDYNNTSASSCMTSSVNQYNLWEKEPEMMMRISHQFIDASKIMQDDKYSIRIMKVIFGLAPKCPNEEVTKIIDGYLKSIPSLMSSGHEVKHHLFDLLDTLADIFVRTESKQILADLSYTNDIVMSSYIGDAYLTSIIVKADSYRNPDRFWEIWNSFRNIVPNMVSMNCNQQLRTYLLNTQWVDDVKEWHSLRPQDLDFFMFMAENAGGNATVFNGLVSILITVGTNYKKEGMRWISTAIKLNPNLDLRETPALQYLELIMMQYIYANKMQIRQNSELLVQVRTILNFMVTKSSVTGYVLRDLVN